MGVFLLVAGPLLRPVADQLWSWLARRGFAAGCTVHQPFARELVASFPFGCCNRLAEMDTVEGLPAGEKGTCCYILAALGQSHSGHTGSFARLQRTRFVQIDELVLVLELGLEPVHALEPALGPVLLEPAAC